MQCLPADLHRYLTRHLDASTNLVFPLTCKLLLENLGQPEFTPRQAVSLAAQDDNLNLMKYFLAGVDKVYSRARRFYNVVILQPALKGNALHVLHWYFQKKYHIDVADIKNSLESIDLLTYDLALSKISRDREYLINGIFAQDRFDILKERYLNRGFVISPDNVREIFFYDAVGCLNTILFGKKNSEVMEIMPLGLRKGGEKIIRYLSFVWKKITKGKPLPMHLLNELLSNNKCNDLSMFKRIQNVYTLGEEQRLLILQHKNLPVVELVMCDSEITARHCQVVLQREYGLDEGVVEYIFGRFPGRLSLHRDIYLRDSNLEVIAEKLISLKCITHNIISTHNRVLFERLLQEQEFTSDNAKMLCHYYDRGMLELYLDYQKIACQDQLYYYTRIGDEFISILEVKGHYVSKQVYARRESDRLKAEKRKLEVADMDSQDETLPHKSKKKRRLF